MFPCPPAYDVAASKDLRVDKYSTITVEGNKYSIPDNLVSSQQKLLKRNQMYNIILLWKVIMMKCLI